MVIPDSVRKCLKQAEHIVIFTGAGVSAESGITTFRDGLKGLWAKYNPIDVASPKAFKDNPQLVWDFYCDRADAVRKAAPNAGHRAIAQLATVVKMVKVVTQNVDGLHQSAGSQDVLELHGNLFRLKPFIDEVEAFADGRSPIICPVCDGYASPEEVDPYTTREDFQAIELVSGEVARCPGCAALLRPDVTWFSEMLDPQVLSSAIEAVDACDVMICIGSSLEVEPAASMPFRVLENGALVVEVNPQPVLTNIAQLCLAGSASTVLPELLMEVWGIASQ